MVGAPFALIAPLTGVRGIRLKCPAACAEFAVWDQDKSADWTPEYDCMAEELADKHRVHGSLMPLTTF
jgi:hypothetical protein